MASIELVYQQSVIHFDHSYRHMIEDILHWRAYILQGSNQLEKYCKSHLLEANCVYVYGVQLSRIQTFPLSSKGSEFPLMSNADRVVAGVTNHVVHGFVNVDCFQSSRRHSRIHVESPVPSLTCRYLAAT